MQLDALSLKTGQVVAALGLSSKYLQNLVEAGYVRPAVGGPGKGSARRFTFADVVFVQAFDILVRGYGLEQKRAAQMLGAAWPEREWEQTRELTLMPAASGMKVTLAPIRLPLARIARETAAKVERVRETYQEKKRGRPEGWRREMRSALGVVAEALQEASEEDLRQAIAAARSRRRAPAGVA